MKSLSNLIVVSVDWSGELAEAISGTEFLVFTQENGCGIQTKVSMGCMCDKLSNSYGNTHGSCHRYQRAVSHLGLLAVSPPYIDGLGTGSMITLSQAILPAR